MKETKLTAFQKRCELELEKFLAKHEVNIKNRKVEGIHEKYVKIQAKGLDIYIYADACDFQGQSIDERFENDEGKTEKEIIEAFLWRLESFV